MEFKIGLKLFSTNVSLIMEARDLYQDGIFHYIELYIIPGSYENTINDWKGLNGPFVIHAPHSYHGTNFAQSEKWNANRSNFIEVQKFVDTLSSDIIIVHGGNNGFFDETLRQLALLDESRIALENKPKIGIDNEECAGYSAEEFQKAFDSGVITQTVLDFGHAVCAANSLHMDPMILIKKLAEFNPKVFHLSDGDISSEKDAHYNLGHGSFDISGFLSVIPEKGRITLETPRDNSPGLGDFVNDVDFIHTYMKKKIDQT